MKKIKELLISYSIGVFFIAVIGALAEEGPFSEKFVDCLIILIALTLLGLVILCGYILVVLCAKDAVKFTKFVIDADEEAQKLEDDSKK